MQRTGIWIIAICFAIVTLAMRYELAAPNISQAFVPFASFDATAPLSVGSVYNIAIKLHHIAGLLVIGAIAIAAARSAQLDRTTSANWIKCGLWLALVLSVISVVSLIPQQVPQFWSYVGGAQMPPLGPANVAGLGAGLGAVSDLHVPVIFSLTLAAIALMLTKSPPERRAANAVCFATLVGLGLYIAAYAANEGSITLSGVLGFGPVWLIALCAFIQSDGDRHGNAYAMIGAAVALGSLFFSDVDLSKSIGVLDDTSWHTARSHLGLLGFSLFAGFAVLDMRLKPRLPRPLVWAHGLALAVALFAAFWPLRTLGIQGMPRGYIDFPDSFADGNLAATIGTYALAVLIVIGVFMTRHYRSAATDQADQQTQAETRPSPQHPDHPPASAPRPVP